MIDGGTQLPATTGINGVIRDFHRRQWDHHRPRICHHGDIRDSQRFPAWLSSGNIGILWSSADCGNDFIQGDVTGGAAPSRRPLSCSWEARALIAGSLFARRSAAQARS